MIRSVLVPTMFVAIGAAAAGIVMLWRAPAQPVPFTDSVSSSPPAPPGALGRLGEDVRRSDIDRRLQRLEAAAAAAAVERQRLTEQLGTIATQLAARSHSAGETAAARAPSGTAAATPQAPANVAATTPGSDDGMSSMERALAAAGLDPATAADMKRRHDGLAMAEIYLRDQATREHWLDSPRFAAEMAAIDAQRTPLRTEIGDDAYDRYLVAMGQTNRVRVDEVLAQSPAEEAGVQAGDLIVRYGDARLFAPGELVDATRSGTAGETVQLEILRNGERLVVPVLRGPLGLRVAATQGAPEAG